MFAALLGVKLLSVMKELEWFMMGAGDVLRLRGGFIFASSKIVKIYEKFLLKNQGLLLYLSFGISLSSVSCWPLM